VVPALPSTSGYVPPNGTRQPSYVPAPPVSQSLPTQEAGQRMAKALPYRFEVNATRLGVGQMQINFQNTGAAGAVFQVRAGGAVFAPRTYTLAPATKITDTWKLAGTKQSTYDLSVFGPNGFLRHFTGGLVQGATANLLVYSRTDASNTGFITELVNDGAVTYHVTLTNQYDNQTFTKAMAPGAVFTQDWVLTSATGWYDIMITVAEDAAFAWRFAGHVEDGADYLTDPGIASGCGGCVSEKK